MAKFKRTVSKLEQCFKVYEDVMEMDVLSFHQIRDWYNERTKDGITSARLINLLRKRPQFTWQHTERKIGSNETLTYWSLDLHKLLPLPNPAYGWIEGDSPTTSHLPNPAEGWVVIEQRALTV